LVRAQPLEAPDVSDGPEGRELHYEWRDGAEHGTAWGASARISMAAGEFSADASLAPSRRAGQNLLQMLAYALVRRSGGAVLHAASVELPKEGVVAFVGPSGAGKSTACEHVAAARFFSADRLAVVPGASPSPTSLGWSAHPLPGGTPLVDTLPASESAGRPLRAVLRIRQAQSGCWFEPCRGSRAVALLRESTFRVTRAAQSEAEQLSRLERLARALPVGELHFSLGTPLGPLLRSWFRDGTLGRGGPADDLG
jgi:hypothetical protein